MNSYLNTIFNIVKVYHMILVSILIRK